MVDWLFLPQNFGPVVGTYEGLLRLCECISDGGSICRWWGHLTTIGGNQSFFLPQVVGTLKPSICHAMHECRLCLWTASQSSPFRLDLEEAYFNISRSLEMLVPLSGGIALRYRSHALPGSKWVS